MFPARSTVCPPPVDDGEFEPAAVGFEYWGGLGSQGELLPFSEDDGASFLEPFLRMRFGSEAYFMTADDLEQERNSCEIVAVLQPLPTQLQIPNRNDAELWQSYDFAVTTDPARFAHSCGEPFDEDADGYPTRENWGEDGQDLIDKFLGAHVAIAFAPMTEYLQGAFENAGGFDQLPEDQQNAAFAMYIAINDKGGNFVAEDWTIGYTFEWDEETMIAPFDNGSLTFKPAETVDGWLTSSYVRSFAYWYQDFPLMNLDNLKDGAPSQP